MAKDRARDDRRSVGSHEKMMGALGRAAGANTTTPRGNGDLNLNVSTLQHWVKPQSVRLAGSRESKIDAHYNKGLITSDERGDERIESAINDQSAGNVDRFHKF
jgi:hypothetical protein